MKNLIEYTIKIKSKEDVTETLENGDKIIKSVEVEKPVKVILKEPSRAEANKANDIYQEYWADGVRRGLLPRAVLSKVYRQNEGIFTKNEIEVLREVETKIEEIRAEYKTIETKNVKSPADESRIKELIKDFEIQNAELSGLESINEALFENSVENLAGQKVVMWQLLFLSYIEKDGKPVTLVEGDTLDQRLANFDKIIEDQSEEGKARADLYNKILDRNGYFLSNLYKGKITVDQLEELNKRIENPELVTAD